MPGGATVKWWETEFVKRFKPKQQSVLLNQLQRYLKASQQISRTDFSTAFTELVIVRLLQQDLELSNTDTFRIWQTGIANQSEDWWTRISATLSVEKVRQLGILREKLGSGSYGTDLEKAMEPDEKIIQILKAYGLSAEAEARIRKHGLFDAHPAEWWDTHVWSKVSETDRDKLRSLLLEIAGYGSKPK